MSKSMYAAETLEKDFEKILSYKKNITHKNSLYFDSPKNSKTGLEFYSNKKSRDRSILPKLSKGEFINPKIKTTSTNFFKNNNEEMNNKLNKLFKIKNSVDLNDNNAIINYKNPLISIKTNSNNSSSLMVNNEKIKKHLFFSETTTNFKNSKDEISDNIYIANNSNFISFGF